MTKPFETQTANFGELSDLAKRTRAFRQYQEYHWQMSGRDSRGYHLTLDAQGAQTFGVTDDLAERRIKLGGTALRSIGKSWMDEAERRVWVPRETVRFGWDG